MLLLLLSALPDEKREMIEQMFKEYKDFFFSIAYNRLRSKESAEDAVQTSYMKIIENIDRISGLPCPERRPYCIKIVSNVSKKMAYKAERDKTVPLFDEYVSGNETDPEKNVLLTDEKEELYRHLQALSETDRELIYWRFYEKYSFPQIAIVSGINMEKAKKRVKRSCEKLRKMMENEGREGMK